MCGIAGIVSITGRPIDTMRLKPMCDIQAHRGPDDAGYAFFRTGEDHSGEGGYWCGFADADFAAINEHLPVLGGAYSNDQLHRGQFQVALGHRRLAIQDLTHYGHQPMSNSDRRYWIVFNGEIYNFPQLREELEGLGHRFRTRCDTEVILEAWQQWGEEALPKLDGMFAFALYDRISNTLTLARDRFGVKPLYYAITDDMLVFASETKGILASQLLQPRIHAPSVVEYFTFQNVLGTETLFKGVHLLAPGETITLRPGRGEPPRPARFHTSFPLADGSLADCPTLTEQVAEAFGNAVKRQLISDVQVGAYLSGGMDSGSIVSVTGRTIPRLLTFTGGFDLTSVDGIEQGFDERRSAEQLSYLLQTEHYDVVLHAGDMPAAMKKISWHMDDPRVGMCHQNWYVAKLASRFVKVCLAGVGGDEFFGGYPWRYRQGLGAETFADFDEAYFAYWHRFDAPDQAHRLFAGDLQSFRSVPRERYETVMQDAPAWQKDCSTTENMIQRAVYFEIKTFLNGLLVTEDHISMAHSLETRVPFLDNALGDLACRIPASRKIRIEGLLSEDCNGHIESVDGKTILRDAMRDFLPKEFTQQQKQGFSPPDANWYRGPSVDYIKSILLDAKTRQRPWFDQAHVGNCLEEHFQGQHNHRLLIWSLLSFEWLQRHFIDQPV